ncbi:MAG: hypothetical protein ACF8OB_14925 [Phycisphaeraceae bacterium JB051]
MEAQRANRIIRKLADGLNPITEQSLPADSVYHHPEIIRALFNVLERLDSSQITERPNNAGKPWTESDDRHLSEAFEKDPTIHLLAQRYGRTEGAIKARLVRLGLIEKSDVHS